MQGKIPSISSSQAHNTEPFYPTAVPFLSEESGSKLNKLNPIEEMKLFKMKKKYKHCKH